MLTGTISSLLRLILEALSIVVLVYALLSWIPNISRNSPFVRIITSIAEPVCAPVRRIIPPRTTGNVDLSPVIVLILISILQRIL